MPDQPRDAAGRFADGLVGALARNRQKHARTVAALHPPRQQHRPTPAPPAEVTAELMAAREARIVAERDLARLQRELDNN